MSLKHTLLGSQTALCLATLLAACSQQLTPAAAHAYPEPHSTGAKVLKDKCAGCHAAPLPSTHTAQEWQAVLFRMQNHRIMNGLAPLSETENAALLSYLQRHAEVRS